MNGVQQVGFANTIVTTYADNAFCERESRLRVIFKM